MPSRRFTYLIVFNMLLMMMVFSLSSVASQEEPDLPTSEPLILSLYDSDLTSEPIDIQASGSPLTGYYTPCQGGTSGNVSTLHGINRDGTYPVDRSRRSYDFRCDANDDVYAPIQGVVKAVNYDQADNYYLLMEDTIHDVCMIILHLNTIFVSTGDDVFPGMKLAQYSSRWRHVHIAAFNGPCGSVDIGNGNLERPIIWTEIGRELEPDITAAGAVGFTSQNGLVNASAVGWDFAESRHGWTNGNNVSWIGHFDGGAVWGVDGNDPSILSPRPSVPEWMKHLPHQSLV